MPVGSDEAKMFAGPSSLLERDAWRANLQSWKIEAAARINYDDSLYSKAPFKAYESFNMALIWLWDELIFDFKTQEFTPEKLLEDCKKFGGIDGVILWHAYPVIGIDSRNQFDFYNQVDGLDKLISTIQRYGVKVYLNYNPWDLWTSRPEKIDQEELALLVEKYNFDGVFLDTMKSADPSFMEPILKVNPNVILAGEARVQQERICDHTMSWAQWFGDSDIPGVIRAKWFEHRHMLHQTRRWNRSHIEELHIAWLNGAGMLLWEVVFGSWVGWNRKETHMWKEMVQVLRKHARIIGEGSWEPLTALSDEAESHGLYGSKFASEDSYLITVINKNDQLFAGEIIDGLVGIIPGKGVAAIVKDENGLNLAPFTCQELDSNFFDVKPLRNKELVGASQSFTITYRNRECGLYDGAPFIEAWKPLPPNFHQKFTVTRDANIRNGELSVSEVTNKQFGEFIVASGYEPRISTRFLAHWVDGRPKTEDLELPVTFVELDDAVAYATWAGCVIPTEWEWQFYADKVLIAGSSIWNLTDSVHSDGRTRFLILKGGCTFSIRNGQGQKSTSGIAESDWYVDGGPQESNWVEKLLMMGRGMNRSENIGFRCFIPEGSK